MNTRFDLLGYDKNNQLVLITEIKKRLPATEEWATQLRRNILAHGFIPDTQYFLVVLPDRLYLWKNAGVTPELVKPDYSGDTSVLLGPYYLESGLSPEDVSGQTFEILVASLLRDLLTQAPDENTSDNWDWLYKSGLYHAIQGGRIEQEAVVA